VARSLQVFLSGQGLAMPGPRGERILDHSFMLLFNGDTADTTFTLPGERWGKRWRVVFDTAEALPRIANGHLQADEELLADDERPLAGRSILLLQAAPPQNA
jgi:glycogen operon protein